MPRARAMRAHSLHRLGSRLVAVLFAVLALSAFTEVLSMLRGTNGAPVALGILQTLVGSTAAATALGAWTGARWAPAFAAAYGVITAAMLVSLGPLLEIPAADRGGLRMGAAAVLLVALGCAWYLRHAARRAPVAERERSSV